MNFLNFDIFPEQASTFAEKVDPLFYFLTVVSLAGTTIIVLAILILGVKFRKKKGENRKSEPLENVWLEITWTIIPAFFFLAVFVWGAKLYADYLNPPDNAMQIDIVGKQWMWKAQHSNGMREVNSLHVPVGRPVILNMSSQDVVHSFYLPAMRVKQDVIPGRFTYLWFEATKVGEYHLFCAEYCGTEHSYMRGTVTVMEEDDYVEWLAGGPKKSPVDAGEFLFSQRGCATCHNATPESRGPNLEGVFGSEVTLSTGTVRMADEEYIRESIMEPGKTIVEGYTALMPSFANQVSAEDMINLIAYIKSLGLPETDTALTEQ